MKGVLEFDEVYLHREPVDMRKGIHGLMALVEGSGMGPLTAGKLFVFSGRRRDLIKILYFDISGYALWMKRLEEDKFKWPKKVPVGVVVMTPEQLQWLLSGFDFTQMKPFNEVKYDHLV